MVMAQNRWPLDNATVGDALEDGNIRVDISVSPGPITGLRLIKIMEVEVRPLSVAFTSMNGLKRPSVMTSSDLDAKLALSG